MNSKKTATPSRSSHRAAPHGRASAAKRSRAAAPKAITASPSISTKQPAAKPAAKETSPVGQRILKTMKSKAGIAAAAGVVIAASLGLVHKYRSAH